MITELPDAEIRVLEIGCGAGATLAKIKYNWINSEVKGIELDRRVVELGKNYLDIIEGNIETIKWGGNMQTFYYTDTGKVRSHNEDSITIINKENKEKQEIISACEEVAVWQHLKTR